MNEIIDTNTYKVVLSANERDLLARAIRRLVESHAVVRDTRPEAYDILAHATAAAALIALNDAEPVR